MPARLRADLLEHLVPERVRRQDAGRVARVHAGLLDVLHDPADPDVLAVAERVDVDLDRVLQEAVEEDRGALARGRVALEVVQQPVGRVDDLHRAPAEDVARAHEQREADAPGDARAPRPRRAPSRRAAPRSPARSSSAPKRPRSSARSIASTPVPRMRHARPRSSPCASLSGVWPPNWTMTPSGRSTSTTAEHVLERQRLEVQPVGRVVVRRDRLGVAVDHHRVAAGLADGHRRVHAAVVELDALADAVGPGAEDHDATAGRRGATSSARRRSQPE